MTKKKLFITAAFAVILIFAILSCVYVNNAEKRYESQDMKNAELVVHAYLPFARTSCIDLGYFKAVISSDRTAVMETSRRELAGLAYNNDPFCKIFDVKISRLEYYIILDYIYMVLAPAEGKDDDSFNFVFPRCEINCGNIIDYDRIWSSRYFCIEGRSFKKFFIVWFAFLTIYIRRAIPICLLLFIIFGLIVRFAAKKYFAKQALTMRQTLKTLFTKAKSQLHFILISCGAMLLTEIIIHTPYKWSYKLSYYLLLPHGRNMGVREGTFLIFLAVQTAALILTARKDRIKLCFAFLVPTTFLFFIQKYFFETLLFENYNSKTAVFVRSFLGINEGVISLAVIPTFTLFFFIGLVFYFVFGFLANKSPYRNFAQSTAFAAVNAFMCCTAAFVAAFGSSMPYR